MFERWTGARTKAPCAGTCSRPSTVVRIQIRQNPTHTRPGHGVEARAMAQLRARRSCALVTRVTGKRATISSTISSTGRSVVSMTTASSACTQRAVGPALVEGVAVGDEAATSS